MHRLPISTEAPAPLSANLPSISLLRPGVAVGLSLALIASGGFWNVGIFQLAATWSENRLSHSDSDLFAGNHADDRAVGARTVERRFGEIRVGEIRFGEMRDGESGERFRSTSSGSAEPAQRADVRKLTKEQHTLAQFLAKRYRVALDSAQEFVDLSYRVARDLKLDPWLILAIMGIESSFDPNATSNKGAQGLMQVLTRVHADKFTPFGGVSAAFDPLANIRVGAKILKDYIDRDGSIESGLKSYVGAAFMASDSGYGGKVLVERERLAAVAEGRPMNLIAIRPAGNAETLKPANGPSIIEISARGESSARDAATLVPGNFVPSNFAPSNFAPVSRPTGEMPSSNASSGNISGVNTASRDLSELATERPKISEGLRLQDSLIIAPTETGGP
jgi:Transglycosylase SLT domain